VAFIVAQDAVSRIGKPDAAVGVYGQIVRSIEQLALEVVGQHGDGSVVFGARDPACIVLAGNETALAIARVAVAVIRRLAEDADFSSVFEPAQDAIVGNVAPQQIPAVTEPNRAFGPAASGVEALDDSIGGDELRKARIEDLDVGVGVVGRSWQDPGSALLRQRWQGSGSYGVA